MSAPPVNGSGFSPGVAVSDHAVVRYLERAKGVDVAAIKAEIAALVDGAVRLGNEFSVQNGCCFVLEGRAVVTVLGPDQRLKPRSKWRRRRR